ncbi:MAG: FhaA domain-containing protein [Canibacter sp.]
MDSVERGLERAVNGAFARTFRSGVQPVEIAAGLKRELDIQSVIVDRDRVLTANQFNIRVSPEDAERLDQYSGTLQSELESVVARYADDQGYQLLGPAVIAINADDTLTRGILQIDAAKPSNRVAWEPTLEIAGKRYPLRPGTTVVGRGSEADVRINDNGASRKHLEIIWDGKRGIARDLGSTNGSKVNGQRFRELKLEPDTVISIGQTSLRFRLIPAAPTTFSRSEKPASRSSSQSSKGAGFWEDL